jgi:beta-lactamase regulating signal transducer with metallopeptidase domain
MISTLESVLSGVPWIGGLALLLDVAIKGTVLCALAATATFVLRRSSAFVRSTVWVCAIVALMLLPAFSLQSPVWNLPILPDLTSWSHGSYEAGLDKNGGDAPMEPPAATVDAPSAAGGIGSTTFVGMPWYAWGILLWITGGVFCLAWYLVSQAGVQSIVRQARPACGKWTRLLGKVSHDLDVGRDVRLLESDRLKAAITFGILKPVVVLPADCDDWPASRRRLVLSHELAHVKRWDTLTEMFALFATILYWFNPFVWFAVRRMRIERETDCDNAVLKTGVKPSDYAELLMNIAADLSASPKPVWQLSTISQSSNVKDRLMDILNSNVNRASGSRRSVILIGILAMSIVLPISTSSFWTNASSQTKDESYEKKKAEKKAKWDAMSDEEKEAYKAAEKAKWDAMSAEEKSAAMWERVCVADNSAACIVGTKMQKYGVEAGLSKFAKLKAAEEGKFVFDEKQFNSLGYAFLYVEQVNEAIAVLELNVREYPESWNTYDSLGEAYMVAKNYDKAIELYEVAVTMNPESEHSISQLNKLRTMVAGAQ